MVLEKRSFTSPKKVIWFLKRPYKVFEETIFRIREEFIQSPR